MCGTHIGKDSKSKLLGFLTLRTHLRGGLCYKSHKFLTRFNFHVKKQIFCYAHHLLLSILIMAQAVFVRFT